HNPIAHQPLPKLVGPGAKVTIAFDDMSGAAFRVRPPDFRQQAIESLIEELTGAGVALEDIRLLCAQGLHRKLTRLEMESFLGRRIVLGSGYSRLYSHDAEDGSANVHLGETKRGFEVEVNRAVVDSDQLIYLNTMNSPFNGGWKSIVVGLGTYRNIRHHHRPFPGASGKSTDDPERSSFHKLIWEMGDVVKSELERKGRRIFTIETVYNNATEKEMIGIFAGHPPEVHVETLKVMSQQYTVDVEGQTDLLIAGLPNQDTYSKFSIINPLLVTNLGMAYTVSQFQNMPLLREGGIAILCNPFLRQFDAARFAPYVEFYERLLSQTLDPYQLWEENVEDFAHRPEYVHGYRYGYAYHGAHPFFMWNSTLVPRRYLSRIFFAGVRDFAAVRRCGFEPFATVEEAVREAEATLGPSCRVTLLQRPPAFIPRVISP
ncbi:MAG: lactate racemase domain-containing protein, partial [Dehalococcoidia bacterium]